MGLIKSGRLRYQNPFDYFAKHPWLEVSLPHYDSLLDLATLLLWNVFKYIYLHFVDLISSAVGVELVGDDRL